MPFIDTPLASSGQRADCRPDSCRTVSAIVPNYNYARYLEQRLRSICEQTYPVSEVVVLDDASTDNSIEVITSYLDSVGSMPSRLLRNERNSGSAFAQWSKGAVAARGEYPWICEADDYADARFLESVIPKFADEKVVIAYTQSRMVDDAGKPLSSSYLKYTDDISRDKWLSDYCSDGRNELANALAIKNTIPSVSGVLFRKKELQAALAQSHGELSRLPTAGDWLIYSEILKMGKICFLCKQLNYHRVHERTLRSSTRTAVQMAEVLYMQKRIAALVPTNNAVAEKAARYGRRVYRHLRLASWCRRDPRRDSEVIRALSVMEMHGRQRAHCDVSVREGEPRSGEGPMSVATVSTRDINGGAARAAFGLHQGLNTVGQRSVMLVREKASADDTVIPATLSGRLGHYGNALKCGVIVQERYIDRHRTPLSNTLFSLGYPGYDLAHSDMLMSADVINLHWINYFQSLITIKNLFSLNVPVVWTLHDQWAFTGGCHYSAGCEQYADACSRCPQLSDDPYALPAAVLRDKIDLFEEEDITIVTPSRWLADCARRSRLFQKARIEIIPNSVDTGVFSPVPRREARRLLNLPSDARTLLFGAEATGEKRKGFKELLDALRRCMADGEVRSLVDKGKLRLLAFGHPDESQLSGDLPVTSFGYVTSDERLRTIYSAADVFIVPSLEDNLPNTMLEAMGCGTPVIAFDVGGMSDLISDKVTGLLVEPNNIEHLSRAIIHCILHPDHCADMGDQCGPLIDDRYTREKQANAYVRLYRELCANRKPGPSQRNVASAPETGSVRADLDSSTGPHFSGIYEQVLTTSLRDVKMPELLRSDRRLSRKGLLLLFLKMIAGVRERIGNALSSRRNDQSGVNG
ncbi:MAG: glycosyltransferase [Planctomycetota bacterium]|jgi:glycosyltransferase involved in cell wall biosynthesis